MAKYYGIDHGDLGQSVGDALVDYYGGGVSLYYQAAGECIFYCGAISNKVIRINKGTYSYLLYGDSWTSGTTITNSVQFYNSTAPQQKVTGLVFEDNFAVFLFAIPPNMTTQATAVIGQLTNSDYVAVGTAKRNTSDGQAIHELFFPAPFYHPTKKLYKQPIMFKYDSGELLMYGSGPATIEGLVSISTAQSSVVLSGDYVIAPTGGIWSTTSLFVELD